MAGWSFYTVGSPAAQGSKRHVGHGVMIESSKKVRPWRDSIIAAAPTVPAPLDGPIALRIVFTVARPKTAKKTIVAPSTRPDVDKLLRSTFDGIGEAGLWTDDARVCDFTRLAKVWWGYDSEALPVPGVIVAACEIDAHWSTELHNLFASARNDAIQRIRGAA